MQSERVEKLVNIALGVTGMSPNVGLLSKLFTSLENVQTPAQFVETVDRLNIVDLESSSSISLFTMRELLMILAEHVLQN